MAVETSTVHVVMPAMGDSVTEGTVLEWHKHEGDPVEADETIVEISTDKVDAEVPAPVSGTLVKVHASEGDTVAVGALLAEIATTDGAGDGASGPSPVAGATVEAESTADASQASTGDTVEIPGTGRTVDIVTPTGGESVTEGTILEWSVKVGDAV